MIMKIMFDTNAFNSLLESGLNWADKDSVFTKYEFYITAVQVEELANTPDTKKEIRIQNFLELCLMKAKLVPTIAVMGYTRIGFCTFTSEDEARLYESLLPSTRNQKRINDALIGVAANKEGCTIITDDNDFIKKLNANGIPVMRFQAWKETL